jgi:CBS domain containing-hemolysin-like protein
MVPSQWVYRPFIKWLNGTGLLFLRMLGSPPQSHRHIHSPEEIELLIADSRDGGLLEPDEHLRSALNIGTPLKDAIAIVARSPYSRLPVYRDTIDNIVGMLHTKDLVRWLVANRDTDGTVASLVRPIASVHESVTADKVLRELRERRAHQALVVDEFGGTSGLLTLEDVLSELIGDVGDEYKAGEPVPEELSDGVFRLPGGMMVEDAATLLKAQFETDATTVGGLVTAALGHLPNRGERATIGDYEFEIEGVAERAVQSVIARRQAVEPAEGGE